MDSLEPPKLNHGIPEPEVFLPDTPDWYWWVVALGAGLTLLLAFWIFRLLRPARQPEQAFERDLLTPALDSLDELEKGISGRLLSEVAAETSLAIRRYLAGTRSEPALYETAEEFEARQAVLPAETNRLLNELNDAKYAKSEVREPKARQFVERARQELRALQAVPAPAAPAPLQERTAPRERTAKALLVAIPAGLIVAVVSFLVSLYDGPDTGSNPEIAPLVWIALTISTVSLFVHLMVRPTP